jgi:hypothetical protein
LSDADAQAWATAANRAAVWYRWAEQQGQISLLKVLVKEGLVPSTELSALSSGATIDEPDCSSFGTRFAFFQLAPNGGSFFAGLGQSTSAQYVLAETYPGPCQISAVFPDGHAKVLFSYASPGTTVFAGAVRHDILLGDFWYSEAAADCAAQHPPQTWCAQ